MVYIVFQWLTWWAFCCCRITTERNPYAMVQRFLVRYGGWSWKSTASGIQYDIWNANGPSKLVSGARVINLASDLASGTEHQVISNKWELDIWMVFFSNNWLKPHFWSPRKKLLNRIREAIPRCFYNKSGMFLFCRSI